MKLDPRDADAHFVLAVDALESRTPNVPEAQRHLKVLEEKQAPPVRRLWIRAKLADATGDSAGRAEAFGQAASRCASRRLPADRPHHVAADHHACRSVTKPIRRGSSALVQSLLEQVKHLTEARGLSPARVARLRSFLELTQRGLIERSAKAPASDRAEFDRQVEAIEVDLEAIFKLALSGEQEPDLQTFLTYADHLRFRRQRDRCLEVIDQALKSPQASRRNATHRRDGAAHGRRRDGAGPGRRQGKVRQGRAARSGLARLARATVPGARPPLCRLDRARPVGHRTRSGGEEVPADSAQKTAPKLRTSAMHHLKLAAAQLPDIAEAQARYGVALVLAGEQNLGRQFLQNALRLGSLDAQYQLWAAWTVLQAGYPEEAEPIVSSLFQQVAAGNAPRELSAALYLLRGEVFQARRTPENLKKAASDFEKALAAGPESSATVLVRLAQIDVQLGEFDRAIARIDALERQGKGTPSAQQLAILTLEEQGKKTEARTAAASGPRQVPCEPRARRARRGPAGEGRQSRPKPTGSWLTS